MKYEILNVEQGSEDWYQARLGKWTASSFKKALTPTGKPSKQAEETNYRLVAEKIIGEPDETFQSDAMLRGQELEEEALRFLNFSLDTNFEPCGFVDSGKGYGCSPDAIDREKKIGLELKCPLPHTQIKYLAAGVLPPEYFLQVHGSMWVLDDFDEWIFCSFHPLIKPLILTVKRDKKVIEQIETAILPNVEKVEKLYTSLKNDLKTC